MYIYNSVILFSEPQESTEITIQSRDCGRIIGKNFCMHLKAFV